MTVERVLLHGFTGAPSAWRIVRAELRQPERAHALPLLGHAPDLVEGPEQTFDDELDRLASVVVDLGDPVDVVGYSLGGRMALGLAVRHPDLVRRAVLVGANPGLDADAARAERGAADARSVALLESGGLEAFVAKWEALPLFATQQRLDADALLEQRRVRLDHDPRGLARSLRITGLAAMPSYWPSLPSIAAPITWVAGALDAKFSAIAQRACDQTRRGSLALVADAGHNIPLERPRALASVIDEALA